MNWDRRRALCLVGNRRIGMERAGLTMWRVSDPVGEELSGSREDMHRFHCIWPVTVVIKSPGVPPMPWRYVFSQLSQRFNPTTFFFQTLFCEPNFQNFPFCCHRIDTLLIYLGGYLFVSPVMEALWLINHSSGRGASAESGFLAFRREGDYSKHIFWVLRCGPHIINSPVIAFHLLWGNRVEGIWYHPGLANNKILSARKHQGVIGKCQASLNHIFNNKQPSCEKWTTAQGETRAICHSGRIDNVRRINAKYALPSNWGVSHLKLKLPEREIQKSLSILKARHFLSALKERGESVSKQTAVKKGSVWLPLVWEVHVWETDRFTVGMQWKMGEKMLVSMATSVMETSVWAQWQSGIETPRIFVTLKRCRSLAPTAQLYRCREEEGEVSGRAQSSLSRLTFSPFFPRGDEPEMW